MTAIPADFPWRAGMLTLPDHRGVSVRVFRAPSVRDGSPEECRLGPPIADGLNVANVSCYARGADMVDELDENDRPDPNDPATLGALLGAVREAYGDPYGHATWDGLRWTYSRPPTPGASGLEGMLRHIVGSGPTEFDALLAAWNARPKAST